ncbi:Transcription factor PRE4 [Glycine max]|nr:Transcription factor PRE4 [Glycine max]
MGLKTTVTVGHVLRIGFLDANSQITLEAKVKVSTITQVQTTFSMSGQRNFRTSKFTESEINDLMLRLQALLPQLNQTRNSRASESLMKIMKETCSHINRLQNEVKDLGERLAELIDSVDLSDIDEECLTRLLQQ